MCCHVKQQQAAAAAQQIIQQKCWLHTLVCQQLSALHPTLFIHHPAGIMLVFSLESEGIPALWVDQPRSANQRLITTGHGIGN